MASMKATTGMGAACTATHARAARLDNSGWPEWEGVMKDGVGGVGGVMGEGGRFINTRLREYTECDDASCVISS